MVWRNTDSLAFFFSHSFSLAACHFLSRIICIHKYISMMLKSWGYVTCFLNTDTSDFVFPCSEWKVTDGCCFLGCAAGVTHIGKYLVCMQSSVKGNLNAVFFRKKEKLMCFGIKIGSL